jgi:short-subunit dehydrogenase
VKNAIIIGASSGIGRALVKVLASNGYNVGLAARRVDLLRQAAAEVHTTTFVKAIDVSKPDAAMQCLRELIAEMNDVELFVISAGTGFINRKLDWEPESDTIAVNVCGFAAVANVAVEHLQARGAGCLVGISSIAALRGNADAPAYNASKAFMSNYLQGLRYRFVTLGLPVVVTDVQPGFVDTAMAKADRKFWVASPEKAAEQIFAAVRKRKKHVYVTRRWRLIAWLIKAIPDWLAQRLAG